MNNNIYKKVSNKMPTTGPDMSCFMDDIFLTLDDDPKDQIMKDVFSDVWTPEDDLLGLNLNTMNDLSQINELDSINNLSDMDLSSNLTFDNDLASPLSSDSGLSSPLSLNNEEQLSPLLSFDNNNDNQNNLNNQNFNPDDLITYEPFCSSNKSFDDSIDSPMRSVDCSSIGSPETHDVIEEMDFQPNMVAIPQQTDIESSINNIQYANIKQEIVTPAKIDKTPIQTQIIQQKPIVYVKNIQSIKSSSSPSSSVTPVTPVISSIPAIPAIPATTTKIVASPTLSTTSVAATSTKPSTTSACNGKQIQKLIRVSGSLVSGNSRSLLITNFKDIKNIPGIKILGPVQAKNLKNFKINQGSFINKTTPITIKQEDTSSEQCNQSNDDISETETQYPRLKLNNEEKRLLEKENITLPSRYPLSKEEERELKRIRRKIRNKISAQDSRKRKKEYVDGLEDRVKQCTEENMTLLKRIKALQTQNQSLAGQLKRLQALIQKGNKSAQPATCLMVLLLSLALVAAPNLSHRSKTSPNELTIDQEQPENMPINGRSRNLLFSKQLLDEDFNQYGEELLQEFEGLLDHDYNSPMAQMPVCKRPRYDNDKCNKYSTSMDHIGGTLNKQSDIQKIKLSRQYIEPPLDDVWPPPKQNIAKPSKIVDKLEALTNELKINISDADGTRTVLVKVPQEQ